MNALLLVVLAAQQPQVSASVDRVEATVGDLVTLSIRVEARGGDPIRVIDPVLSGFEVRGTSEATQVRLVEGVAARTYTRELRLIAMQPGTATIGPVRVRHGDEVVETAAMTVTIRAPAGGAGPALSAGVRALVDSVSPPPGGDEVVLRVLAFPSRLVLGAQLDLVTLAWFRRDVRRQLRTPPTLTPPEVEGVWSYRQNTPTGIVASRRSGQWWYDLFVSHQVLFPLSEGTLRVGPATVSYVVPLTYSFLSRELQHEVQSDALSIAVQPQPAAGRPPGFAGAAGSGISVEFSLQPTRVSAGGAATATVTVDGIGNVALWPEPQITWPFGVRVYPTDVRVDLVPRDGRVAGQKRFTYLLVADSAGTHPIPAINYSYFDPDRRRYERAAAAGTQIIAPAAALPSAMRPAPPALMAPDRRETLSARLDDLPVAWWLVLFLVPPVLGVILALARRPGRRPRPAAPGAAPGTGGPLDELDHELRLALTVVVPDAELREGATLAAALRAAGVDPHLAMHAVRVRERLQQAVFGPAGGTDPDELHAETREVLRALQGEAAPTGRRRLLPVVVLLLSWGPTLDGQETGPERLYEAGAVRPAADAFLARAEAEPRNAAHWYNLGNAFYRLGEDGRARVAWTRAARLAPRDPHIRRALDLLPEDPTTEALIRVSRVSSGELLLVGAMLWGLAWVLIRRRGVRALGWGVLAGGVLLAAAGAKLRSEAMAPVAVVVVADAPIRVAPFGSADAARIVSEGGGVRIVRRDGPWLLVSRGDTRGWLHTDEVARL